MPRLNPPPARIVVKEVNWLGDLVMSLPALRAVRHAWPEAHLAVLIKRELASFFDDAAWLDEVIPYRTSRGFGKLRETLAVARQLRARHFDLAILFPSSFESALWARLGGVRRRAGFATDGRSLMLTHRATPTRDASKGQQVNWWLEMLSATLGIAGNANDFALEPGERNLAAAGMWLRARRKRADAPLIAIAPAAAYGPAKEWPAEYFARLIDLLVRRRNAECVLVGAPGERAKCEQVASLAGSGALVAAGETTIGELIAMLALADGFAGNDSGCMHVAGALGKPTVAVFGSTDPMRTGPFGERSRVIWRWLECSPCLARTCKFGHYNCLREVTAEEVAAALWDVVDGKSQPAALMGARAKGNSGSAGGA